MTDNIEVPKEAVDAVKLTRADAVKLVAAALTETVAQDVASCERRVEQARGEFRAWAVATALKSNDAVLSAAADAVGAELGDLSGTCTFRVYDDGTDSGDVAQVVFADHQATFEARLRIALNVRVDGEGARLRDAWAAALVDLKAAKERDTRAGAMSKDAREILIKSALDSSDEGRGVVAAVKALAASLKGKV